MLRLMTAGESHGKGLVVIVEGLPAGVPIDVNQLNADLARRQGGYGRGGRMLIEKDRAEALSGLRHGYTLGSPVALYVENKDWPNWEEVLAAFPAAGAAHDATLAGMAPVPPQQSGAIISNPRGGERRVTRPRPGHADLTGSLKYNHYDARNVLERASARETTMRVAAGALAKQLLAALGIWSVGHVLAIGSVEADISGLDYDEILRRADASDVRCADPEAGERMRAEIKAAKQDGDSLGGVVEAAVIGLPPGLGSHVHYDRNLHAALAGALMSLQAAKAVEMGDGCHTSRVRGSLAHDEIAHDADRGYHRLSNRAGGTEGGMSNGMPLVVHTYFKPISTLYKPLRTVDMASHEALTASVERSDACAIPAASVIAEAVVDFEVARFVIEKFGGDSLTELQRNHQGYLAQVKGR